MRESVLYCCCCCCCWLDGDEERDFLQSRGSRGRAGEFGAGFTHLGATRRDMAIHSSGDGLFCTPVGGYSVHFSVNPRIFRKINARCTFATVEMVDLQLSASQNSKEKCAYCANKLRRRRGGVDRSTVEYFTIKTKHFYNLDFLA